MRSVTAAAAAAAFCLLAAAPALAQDYTDQVYRQLHRRYRALAASGKALRLETTVINAVDAEGSDDWTFEFEAGKRYALIAACDDDCGDIDLQIEDADGGGVLVEDTQSDATPVVTFAPVASGRYTVSVRMYDCSAAYCYSGFSLYSF